MEDQESRPSVDETMAKSAELGRDAKEIRLDTRKAGLTFLKTELATGLTFAKAAMDSKDDIARRSRNQANARKAYDTIEKWVARFSESEAVAFDTAELEPELSELRKALVELGENV